MFAIRGHDTEIKADQLRKLANLPNRSAAVRYAVDLALRHHRESTPRDLSDIVGKYSHLRLARGTKKLREDLYRGMDV